MKLALKIVGAFVGLVIVLVLAFVFLVDANQFKPRIEAIAKDQGIALQINGDLGWNLWPSLGVAVNEVRVAALDQPALPIAEIKQASLLLALMPLFSGEFKVDHVAVDGANVSLSVDAAGKGNWEALIKQDETAPPPQPEPAGSDLKLDIQHISLTSSKVSYTDAQSGQNVELRDLNLSMSDVNLRSTPFPLELSFVAEMAPTGGDKLEMQGKLNNSVSLDSAFSNANVTDGNVKLDIKGKESASLDIAYSLALTDLQNNLAYKGQIKTGDINARKLLAALGTVLDTADRNALSKVSLSSSVEGTAKKVALDNLQLALDSTSFKGSLAITDFSTSEIKVVLDGDTINVDNYLPPPVEPPAAVVSPNMGAVTPPAPSAADDTELPVELLRGLNINATLSLQKMTINKMDMENVVLKVIAKNGMIEPELSAKIYSGTVTAKGQLDARGSPSQLQFDAGVNGLELEPLLKDQEMDSRFGLKGAVQMRAMGSAQGNSTDQLFKSLRSTANFSGAQVQVSPINLEEQFCKLVNLVNKSDAPAQKWDAYTEMSELSGSIKIRDQIVTIDTFKAGVEKLQLGSRGKINLATDQYDIFLPFKLLKDTTDTVTTEQVAVTTSGTGGCSIGSQYWLERGLELLRCKGSFAEINPLSDCRPDKDLMLELTKDYAAYKIKEKHGAKIEEKKEELKQKVDDKKNQLLDKLQQRLNKDKSSAAASSEAAVTDGQEAQ